MVAKTGFESKSVTGYDNARLTPALADALREVLADKTVLVALNKEELVHFINLRLPEELHINKAMMDRLAADSANFDTKLLPLYSEIRSIIIWAKSQVKISLTKSYLETNKFGEMRKFEFIMSNKFKDWCDQEDNAHKETVGNKYIINIQNNNMMPPITNEEQMLELNDRT